MKGRIAAFMLGNGWSMHRDLGKGRSAHRLALGRPRGGVWTLRDHVGSK